MKKLSMPIHRGANRAVVASLLAVTVVLASVTPARADIDTGVSIGFPGGYGTPQPTYVPPPSYQVQPPTNYVAPAPVYGERDWRGRQQEQRSRLNVPRNGRPTRDHDDGWRDDRDHDHDRDRDRDRHDDRDSQRR
jgi:hypothetical protein